MKNEDTTVFFADNLKELLDLSGKTQAQTAKELGINVKNYRNYIHGRTFAPADVLLRLADYYGVTVDRLVRKHEEEPKKDTFVMNLFNKLDEEEKKLIIHYMNNLIEMKQ